MVSSNPENLTLVDVYPVTWNNLSLLSKDNLSNFKLSGSNPFVNVIVSPVISVTKPLSVPVKPISQLS